MGAIFCKEFKSYLKSSLGYAFAGVAFLITAFQFIQSLLLKNTDISSVFSGFQSVLVFMIPLLTVSLFSKEKKCKTDKILFTAPISTTKIVLGKYFAALAFFAACIALTLTFTVVFAVLAKTTLSALIMGYVGILFFGALVLAIGLLASSFTENSVTAMVISYGVLIFIGLVSMFKSIPDLKADSFLVKAIDFVTISAKYGEFFSIVISLNTFIYFISVTAALIILTIASVNLRNCNK